MKANKHSLHPFTGLFSRTTWVSRHQKGKTSLDLNEAKDDGVLGCTGISWTICKQSAPRSRHIATPTPHHSIFTSWMLFLTPNQQCQSTEGNKHTHTHTHPFNGPLSGTTQVSHYQKGKTNLDFTEARDSGWQWHQLGYMQVCTSLQTDNHTSTPPLLCFCTGRMPFLPPNQQRQSTEGKLKAINTCNKKMYSSNGQRKHAVSPNRHIRQDHIMQLQLYTTLLGSLKLI